MIVDFPFSSQLIAIHNGYLNNRASTDGVSSRTGTLKALYTRHVYFNLNSKRPGQHIYAAGALEKISPPQKNSKEFYRVDAEPRLIWPRSGDIVDSVRRGLVPGGLVAFRCWGVQDSVAVTDRSVAGYGVHLRGSGVSSIAWRDEVSA